MFGAAWPTVDGDELRQLSQPIDFVGINYYLRLVVRDDPSAGPRGPASVPQANCPQTAHGVGNLSRRDWRKPSRGCGQRYGNMPLYITENGAAFDDQSAAKWQPWMTPQRVQYLQGTSAGGAAGDRGGRQSARLLRLVAVGQFRVAARLLEAVRHRARRLPTQRRMPKASARFYAT